jgi:hypothetical protein
MIGLRHLLGHVASFFWVSAVGEPEGPFEAGFKPTSQKPIYWSKISESTSVIALPVEEECNDGCRGMERNSFAAVRKGEDAPVVEVVVGLAHVVSKHARSAF